MDRFKAPGLVWIRRTGKRDGKNVEPVPYWYASAAAKRVGWPIKTVNMGESPSPAETIRRCERLQAEMHDFLHEKQDRPPRFFYNGTVGSLITLYQTHPSSPYQKLQRSSSRPFDVYLRKIRRAHGERLICRLTGLDLLNWHALWSAPVSLKKPRLAGAQMAMHCLKNALTWGAICGYKDCKELREIASKIGFPHPAPRTHAPTATVVQAAMVAAHQLGHPLAALAYAIQFETSARQWDVIGQWIPMSDERPSTVISGGKKWIGPTWASINSAMTLSLTPSKTRRTSKARVHVGLTHCPMVMAELASIPPERRTGPLIVDERTALPYREQRFQEVWRAVRERAGLPHDLWNRDLRAGAITEGGMAGASADDRAKLAGHSGSRTTRKVYDRDVLVASNRVAEARAKFRGEK